MRMGWLYDDHVVGTGVDLFRAVCEEDLEGIVPKQADAPYDPDAAMWIKVRNRTAIRPTRSFGRTPTYPS